MDNTSFGLNQFLQPFNTPIVQNQGALSGFDFNSGYERSSVNTFNIRDASIVTAKIGSAQITNALLGTAVIGTANIGTLTFNEISGGTINVVANIGAANIKLDGPNKRMIVNDGTNDRVLVGFQSGGF